MSPSYPWKRFWCPPDASINLGDGGYLHDPSDAEWGKFYNPDLVELGDVGNVPCLVLLGEPGMGKSRALEAIPDLPTARSGGATVMTRRIDLREFQTDDRLCRHLFEAPWFTSWSNGSGYLTLFLDSLDECLLRIETVAAILASGLSQCPKERLSLRIACRTADWPPSLGEKLRSIWGDEGARTYELAPLRRVDVVAAARIEGIDAAAFTAEVARIGVVPLAIKPVTLKLLLNLFKRNARLPTRQAELYLQGCRLLCDEVNPERRELKRVGLLSADQQLAVAARIAAVTQFGNRFAVWQGPDQGDVPPEDVVVADLTGGIEAANGDEFEVTAAAVDDTLRYSGLFSSRGPGRLGWAHQTYAEFLAAHFAVTRPLSRRQIMGLLRHPDDPDGRLVPQLHEVAGWLATLSAEVLRQVMVTDPDVLLRSDLSVVAEADRAKLAETLLRLAAEEKFIGTTWRDGYRLDRLAHPGLADQLRPYLRGRDCGVLARRLAVDVATDCGLSVLQDDLAAVALDANDGLDVRVRCAHGVLRLASAETKARLKPLALGLAGDDPDDDLRGCGLRAVWPTALSSMELFAHLPVPQHWHHSRAYDRFVEREILPHLERFPTRCTRVYHGGRGEPWKRIRWTCACG